MDGAQKKRIMDQLEKAARKVFAYKPPAKSEKEERRSQGEHRRSLTLREKPETRYDQKE